MSVPIRISKLQGNGYLTKQVLRENRSGVEGHLHRRKEKKEQKKKQIDDQQKWEEVLQCTSCTSQ